MNKAFTDWYNALSNGEPSYQEAFEAGYAAAQRKVELPVLPKVSVIGKHIFSGLAEAGYTTDQLQAYGQQCAAHARELALEEAIEQVVTLYEDDDYPYLIDVCKAIEELKAGE